jgi:hypothetical protein
MSRIQQIYRDKKWTGAARGGGKIQELRKNGWSFFLE